MNRTSNGRRCAAGVIVALASLSVGACTNQRAAGPVAAAAPPPAAAQVPGAYYVFFERKSADLDDNARGIIAGAARDAARVHARTVHVSGYASTKGDPAANEKLARERAQRVATALIADGVAPWAVAVVPYGEVADVITQQGDRRVRITLR